MECSATHAAPPPIKASVSSMLRPKGLRTLLSRVIRGVRIVFDRAQRAGDRVDERQTMSLTSVTRRTRAQHVEGNHRSPCPV